MRRIFAFASGALFGIGLLISGMTDTVKVIGWLDFFGNWDPTLAFVMGGAIIPMAVAWQVARKRQAPLAADRFPDSTDPRITRQLAAGSVLFGMGWGLVGLCPGPALASIGWGGWEGLLFLVAMLLGMRISVPVKARIEALPERSS